MNLGYLHASNWQIAQECNLYTKWHENVFECLLNHTLPGNDNSLSSTSFVWQDAQQQNAFLTKERQSGAKLDGTRYGYRETMASLRMLENCGINIMSQSRDLA